MAAPSKYSPAHDRVAYSLCLLGATDIELAEHFEVNEKTIRGWRKKFPSFGEACKRGKTIADAQVVTSLYRNAIGYEHKAVKIFADPKTGREMIIGYTERFQPSVPAAIYWLNNRQRGKWRNYKAADPPAETENVKDVAAELREALREMDKADGLVPAT